MINELTQHLPLELPPSWFAKEGAWLESLVWDPHNPAYDWGNARDRIFASKNLAPSSFLPTAAGPSFSRRGTISNAHTGQNGGGGSGPQAATPSRQLANPSRPAPPTPPRTMDARPRLRDTPPRHFHVSKQYIITEQTHRMNRGISDNGWGRVAA